jgi:hypothetical protein
MNRTLSLAFSFFIVIAFTCNQLHAQQPAWLVDKEINHNGNVTYWKILKTDDNNLLIGGFGYLSLNSTDFDFVLRKTDLDGNIIWEKQYGGPQSDELKFIAATTDGFFLAGSTNSEAGKNMSQAKFGDEDVWLVKVDLNGNLLWEKRLGGANRDIVGNIISLPNGSVVMAGSKGVFNNGNFTAFDFWTVCLDKNGNVVWDKTFAGEDPESTISQYLNDIVIDPSGGFLAIGYNDVITDRSNGITVYPKPSFIRINDRGDKQSITSFEGGQPSSGFEKLILLDQGDMLVFGREFKRDGGESEDIVVRKFSSTGLLLIEDFYGGTKTDYFNDAELTTDGGVVIVGNSSSSIGGDIVDFSKGNEMDWS